MIDLVDFAEYLAQALQPHEKVLAVHAESNRGPG